MVTGAASPRVLADVHMAILFCVPAPSTDELSILSQKTLPASSSDIRAQSPGCQSVIVPPPDVVRGVLPATDTTQYLPVFPGISG